MKKYTSLLFLGIIYLQLSSVLSIFATPVIGPNGEDTRGIFAIYFLNIKDFSAPTCTGPSIVLGFDNVTKTPICKSRDSFMKEYFGTQNTIVPDGNIVTGFSLLGTLTSASAPTMIATVFANMPAAPSMQGLVGFNATGPIYNKDIGYWKDNGGSGIRYDGRVQVGNGFTYGITANKISSPTGASASDDLVRKGQFITKMKGLCSNIGGNWSDATGICTPKNCTGNAWGTVNHNTNVTAYRTSTVLYPASCQSQTRFCNNGSLSGSYANSSCIVTYTYSWQTSAYGACNVSCGNGQESRSVWCERSDGATVADSECGGGRPADNRGCNMGACAPTPTCSDGVRNGTETGVDCGGSCGACATPVDGACGSSFTCSAGTLDPDSKEATPKSSYPRGCYYDWICKGQNGGLDKTCNKTVGCFAAEELVRTPYGEVKISELKVGYKVISYDEIKNTFVENTIDRVIVHDGIQSPRHDFDQYPLLDVTITTNGVEKRTKVTANHLYFSPDKKEYQYIGEFNIGDKVTSIDGIGYVVSKKPINLAPTVYNLHMKNQPNNYLVNGVVVHNEKAEACTGCVGASCSVFGCVPNGSCDATAPTCGQTTYGVDNCDNPCSKVGAACAASYRWKKISPSGCLPNWTTAIGDPNTGYEEYLMRSCTTLNEVIAAGAKDKYGSCPIGQKGVETMKCLP